ncbi:MAG: hypothetical protein JW834_00965 [Candidatus Diapherotrites archaeon]|nr:hypothetical protein [Candidatus Diapherotrites archaeon]
MGLRLQNRQVQRFLKEFIGENAVLVLRACDTGCTDEQIMKETKLKLSTIRSTLNQLHYMGLIAYDREKNPNTNWYTYTWFARKDQIRDVVKDKWQTKLEELQKSIEYESSYVFFGCGNGCDKLPFELAAEYDFTCPDCGGPLQEVDNKKRVKELKGEMAELTDLMDKIGA